MNSDGLNGLVSQIGCELEGTFIIGDETIGMPSIFFQILNSYNDDFKKKVAVAIIFSTLNRSA